MSLLLGYDLSLSGLSGSLGREISLCNSAASFLTLQICWVRRQYEVVSFGFVLTSCQFCYPLLPRFVALPIKDELQQCGEGCAVTICTGIIKMRQLKRVRFVEVSWLDAYRERIAFSPDLCAAEVAHRYKLSSTGSVVINAMLCNVATTPL